MSNRATVRLALLTAGLVMGVAVGTASANRLSFSSQNFRIVWTNLRLLGTGTEIGCQLTLEGSFHSATVEKILGALLGFATSVELRNCTNVRASVLRETLPWHVSYQGFTGRLPRIEAIRLLVIVLEIDSFGTICLYGEDGTGGTERTFAGEMRREASGASNELIADNTTALPLLRARGISSFVCHETERFEGTGSVTVLGSTNRITITLI